MISLSSLWFHRLCVAMGYKGKCSGSSDHSRSGKGKGKDKGKSSGSGDHSRSGKKGSKGQHWVRNDLSGGIITGITIGMNLVATSVFVVTALNSLVV